MPFSESLRVAVRKRARLRCCVCQTFGVEIHHIIPQEDSGPDTEDNAAPLCPNCHETYGANPTKRKLIREARDIWFEKCASQIAHSGLSTDELRMALQHFATKDDLAEVKAQLAKILEAGQIVERALPTHEHVSVPIERFIRTLYDEVGEVHESVYVVLFDSRSWYDHGADSYELLDMRAEFLRLYGEETARRVCLVACKENGFDSNGFFEEEFGAVLRSVQVMVMLITHHRKFTCTRAFETRLRPDGGIVWSAVADPE